MKINKARYAAFYLFIYFIFFLFPFSQSCSIYSCKAEQQDHGRVIALTKIFKFRDHEIKMSSS